jgi:glycosyltransferase involved in cell wall biosynthesis
MVEEEIRVCVVSKQDPCSPGGVESVVLGILRELVRCRDFKVLVTYYGKGKGGDNGWCSAEYRSMRPKLLNPIVYSVAAGLDVCSGRYRVVNAHAEAGFGYSLMHRIFRRKKDTLFIQTFHGVSWNMVRSYEGQLRGWKRVLVKLYRPTVGLAEGVAARTADVVVAVSEGVAQELADLYGIDRKKIRVIHNQVDIETFKPRDRSAARKKFHLENGAPYLLYIGKEHIRKGLRIAVEVTEELRREGVPATLIVTGLKADQLPAYARRDSVHTLGWVDTEDLPYLYNAASLLIHPSSYEGHPITVLESLASGTPVVASKGSKVEQPSSAALEIVQSDDISEYVRATKRVLSCDPDKLAVEARSTISTNPNPYSEYVHIIREWNEKLEAAKN